MKKHNLKKVIAIIAALAMVFSLTACGGGSDNTDTYKVAVVKQMDHASLDEIANAICEQLDAIEKEKGVDLTVEAPNVQFTPDN